MSNEVTEGHALTTSLLKLMRKGYNLNDIADKLEISPAKANEIWMEYVDNRLTLPFEHQWILHLDRLETLLVLAREVLESKMDSYSIEAVLKVLDRIEDMQALALSRKEKAQADLVQMTKLQMGLMFQVLTNMQAVLKETIEKSFEKKTIKAIKEDVLGEFDTTFRELTYNALQEVRDDEV